MKTTLTQNVKVLNLNSELSSDSGIFICDRDCYNFTRSSVFCLFMHFEFQQTKHKAWFFVNFYYRRFLGINVIDSVPKFMRSSKKVQFFVLGELVVEFF